MTWRIKPSGRRGGEFAKSEESGQIQQKSDMSGENWTSPAKTGQVRRKLDKSGKVRTKIGQTPHQSLCDLRTLQGVSTRCFPAFFFVCSTSFGELSCTICGIRSPKNREKAPFVQQRSWTNRQFHSTGWFAGSALGHPVAERWGFESPVRDVKYGFAGPLRQATGDVGWRSRGQGRCSLYCAGGSSIMSCSVHMHTAGDRYIAVGFQPVWLFVRRRRSPSISRWTPRMKN